jgi:hypothetical protein
VLVPDTGACTTRSRPASGVQAGSAPEAEGDGRFERVVFNAARQGDARGNEGAAIVVLQAGLTEYADACWPSWGLSNSAEVEAELS